MRAVLVLIANALSSVLRGSWAIVDGLWKWVRSSGPSPDCNPIVQASGSSPGVDIYFEDRLKKWASERLRGLDTRLPTGTTPAIGEWAARLGREELTRVAAAPRDRLAAHFAGQSVIVGVRPAVVFELEDDQSVRLAALRARGANMRAAVARSLAASDERRERADAMTPAM